MPNPRSFSTSSKPPIGYAGYIFTKNPAEHAGQKETWAIVNREQMPASQADLKGQVEKSRKRGVTGLDQYMDSEMKGFKRKQIDELIRDCVRLDPDHRFEYIVASIKRDTRRRQSGPETSTMQVILKRQPRAGIDMQGPPFMGFGSIRLPSGGFVDLSGAAGAEDYERSSQNSSNGHRPGMYPFERHMSEPWVHVDRPDMRPPIHHAHSHQNPHPHDLHNDHAHGDAGHKSAHGLEQHDHHQHDHHQHDHPPFGEGYDVKHGQEEKAKKHKHKGQKPPKIVSDKKHEIHDDHSDLSSASDSDSFSDDTDQTPDTIISSEDSHYHHKDKKHHKDKNHRKSSSHDHEHEPPKRIYREHRRKEPLRRHSSPPPSHRSRYAREVVYVVPESSSHRRQEPLYARERLPIHHRAMSYDDERLHDHDLRGLGRRPTVYRRRIANTAHPVDLYEERAERRRHDILDREIWEKEEAARMRDMARREAAREMMDSERMYHPHSRPRIDRSHNYHDDHFRGYHDDRY